MFHLSCFSSDPDSVSDCGPDPGGHISSCSGADDSRRHSDGAGSPAEDHPAAGGDCSCIAPDPDASSPQPRPADRSTLRCRVPSTAACSTSAAHQGPSSTGWHKSQNPCQAQWGGQLGGTGFPAVQMWQYWRVLMDPTAASGRDRSPDTSWNTPNLYLIPSISNLNMNTTHNHFRAVLADQSQHVCLWFWWDP